MLSELDQDKVLSSSEETEQCLEDEIESVNEALRKDGAKYSITPANFDFIHDIWID